MEVVKTIKLTSEEKRIIEGAMSIIDQISENSSHSTMCEVFDYLLDKSENSPPNSYNYVLGFDYIQLDDI